jgi:hypothetical protein
MSSRRAGIVLVAVATVAGGVVGCAAPPAVRLIRRDPGGCRP